MNRVTKIRVRFTGVRLQLTTSSTSGHGAARVVVVLVLEGSKPILSSNPEEVFLIMNLLSAKFTGKIT